MKSYISGTKNLGEQIARRLESKELANQVKEKIDLQIVIKSLLAEPDFSKSGFQKRMLDVLENNELNLIANYFGISLNFDLSNITVYGRCTQNRQVLNSYSFDKDHKRQS